jgi:hypothetical protein
MLTNQIAIFLAAVYMCGTSRMSITDSVNAAAKLWAEVEKRFPTV